MPAEAEAAARDSVAVTCKEGSEVDQLIDINNNFRNLLCKKAYKKSKCCRG